MIKAKINVSNEWLWKDKKFSKEEWGDINFLVGPNGTGKSLFSEQLKKQLDDAGYASRILIAERLVGLEKQHYDYYMHGSPLIRGIDIAQFSQVKTFGNNFGLSASAFIILKERLDIRIRIEALLSDMFRKNIRLAEEGGFLVPKIQNKLGGKEYRLRESESHGLKEIITLLTFLYSEEIKCIIFDEPELHLHPQFQSFFMSEIRKMAGDPKVDPNKKLFFIITHSPYFLDFRNLDDLKNIVVFHQSSPPDAVKILDAQDEYILKRFLPRFNTHHKQFFFSPNPVFVEGYTDQQIISILFEKIDRNISAAGSCIIDVGGKDELAVFFRLCKKLGIEGIIVADLDAFFRGKVREVAVTDARCNTFVQNAGLGTDLGALIGELETKIKLIADELTKLTTGDANIDFLISALKPHIEVTEKRSYVITTCLLGLIRFDKNIHPLINAVNQSNLTFVISRFKVLLEAFSKANIFIFPKGELEHYFVKTPIDYLNVTDTIKNSAFHTERDHILNSDKATLLNDYDELIQILENVIPKIEVDLRHHYRFQLIEWIQAVQAAIAKGDVKDEAGLKLNAKIDFELFNQIIELKSIKIEMDKKFKCVIELKDTLLQDKPTISFDEKTNAHEFQI